MNYLEQIKTKLAEAKAVRKLAADKSRDLTADELAKVESLTGEIADLRKRQEDVERAAKAGSSIDDAEAWLNRSPGPVSAAKPQIFDKPAPERRMYGGKPRNFKGANAAEKAYRFGQFMLAVAGNKRSAQWCQEHGMQAALADHNETQNYAGGYLVPDEFNTDIIDLREQYGVFRNYAHIVPMASDTVRRVRRAGGLTAYFVAEQAAATKSNKSWDQIHLTAKEVAVMALFSNVLNEDAVINLGDDLAGEIAYAFSALEDNCGWNGDGTSTYGGIVGVRPALTNLSGTIGNIAGLYSAGGTSTSGKTTWSNIVLADFNNVIGRLPKYADGPGAAWFCHRAFWATVMQNLQYAAGGTTPEQMSNGLRPTFMGYPVVISQYMPATTAVSQVCCLLGNLALAACFGDRRGVSIAMSNDATVGSISTFETRQTAILGTQRFDINVHDVGNANATAASRVPGPIVGLVTDAS